MATRIAIVIYPFLDVRRPALGPSILRTAVHNSTGVSVDLHYLNISFRDTIGDRLYDWIVHLPTTLIAGDWVFSEALFGPNPEADEAYKHLLENCTNSKDDAFTRLREARSHVGAFSQWALKVVDWRSYSLIGFSSTFQQHVASLSFAKLIKGSIADVPILFGGANCDGEMGDGTVSEFSFVDYVCCGEGEAVLVDLAVRLSNGSALPKARLLRPATLQDLDRMAPPKFGDYYEQLDRSRFGRPPTVFIPFETSRGCWWGQKSHCTFCGLNGETIRFRKKSPGRAVAEIKQLWTSYGGRDIVLAAADNIMPSDYVKTVLPEIESVGANLFYEVKANLSRDDLRQLHRAGVHTVQPGIEQLSTRLLKLLRKGTTALKNLTFLRDCAQFQIRPLWNFLIGIPEESDSDYESLLKLVPSIFHLPPPGWGEATPIRFDRFSPYFERSDEYQLGEMVPVPAHNLVYHALDPPSARRLAYYFDERSAAPRRDSPIRDRVCELIKEWNDVHKNSALLEVSTDHSILIIDLRAGRSEQIFRFALPWNSLFAELREPTSRAAFAYRAEILFGLPMGPVQRFLDRLKVHQLIADEGDVLVSLSIAVEDGYEPAFHIKQRATALIELVATSESWTAISGDPE